jgi:hypothetical protein
LSNSSKPTNPKDAVGISKPPISTLPMTVIAELGVALMEGARKYGRHNYRAIGVRASVYLDACGRHLMKWWEGEDIDADSGLSHITKAIATLVVLRDSMIQGNMNDDRPPKSPPGFFKDLETQCKAVIEKYPNPMEPWTENRVKDDIEVPVAPQERVIHHPVCRCPECNYKALAGLH